MRQTHQHRFTHRAFALGAALALLPGAAALAQTAGAPPAPVASPGAVRAPAEPLKNPINRNPVYRAQLPDYTPPPPDPRDSSTRPVEAPTSFDQRDTIVELPAPAASASRRP